MANLANSSPKFSSLRFAARVHCCAIEQMRIAWNMEPGTEFKNSRQKNHYLNLKYRGIKSGWTIWQSPKLGNLANQVVWELQPIPEQSHRRLLLFDCPIFKLLNSAKLIGFVETYGTCGLTFSWLMVSWEPETCGLIFLSSYLLNHSQNQYS